MRRKLSRVVDKLRAWRTARDLSQRQAVNVLSDAGLPIKLTTLQKWEIGRSAPHPVTATAIERFLSEQERRIQERRAPTPVILRLKQWRDQNNLTQAEAVERLIAAGVPIKLQTLQQWESGRRHPSAITEVALTGFLDRTMVVTANLRIHRRAQELQDQLGTTTDPAAIRKLAKEVLQLADDLLKVTAPANQVAARGQAEDHKG
jgi:transcriptional regulator with XRE-family HTH domain